MEEEGEAADLQHMKWHLTWRGEGGRIFKLHNIKKNIKLSPLAKQGNPC